MYTTDGYGASITLYKEFTTPDQRPKDDPRNKYVEWNAGSGLNELTDTRHVRVESQLRRVEDGEEIQMGSLDKSLDKGLHAEQQQILQPERAQARELKQMEIRQRDILSRLGPLYQYDVMAIDPGRREVFVGVSEFSERKRDTQRIAKLSSREYHHLLGTIKRSNKIKRWIAKENDGKFAEEYQNKMPCSKVADIREYIKYVKHVLLHLHSILNLFCTKKYKTTQYTAKVAKVRTLDIACRRIIGERVVKSTNKPVTTAKPLAKAAPRQPSRQHIIGSSKITRPKFNTIVGYGAASFSSTSKGNAPICGKALEKRLKRHCTAVIPIDEFMTSQICSTCLINSLINNTASTQTKDKLKAPVHYEQTLLKVGYRNTIKVRRFRYCRSLTKDEKVIKEASYPIHGVRLCPKCHTPWNRDVICSKHSHCTLFTIEYHSIWYEL